MRITRLKKITAATLAAVLVWGLVGIVPAEAQTRFWWQVIDESGESYTGQNVQCSVWRPNTHAAVVLHTTSTLSSGSTSPIWSSASGLFHFYSSSSDPVDVTCWYDRGGSGWSGRIDQFLHKILLPRQGAQIVRFAVNSTAATYQTDSGIVLPQGTVIRDVIIQNLNPLGLGTYHLSVGFLGNHAVATADALVAVQALNSSDEWVRPHRVLRGAGDSLRGTLLGNHRGTALSDYHQSLCLGGVCGATAAGISRYWEVPYVVHVATGLQVSYSAQPGTSAGVRAHVFILFNRLHAPANSMPFRTGTSRNP